MLLEIAAIVVALLVLYKFFIVPEKEKRQKDASNNLGIPGMDPTHPKEGNKEDIKKAGTMSLFLEQLHEKYGPVASFWEGNNKLAVSLASPESFKDIRHLYEIPNHVFEMFTVLTGSELFTFQSVDEIKRRRKIFETHFMMRACKSYTDCFIEVSEDAIKKWRRLGPNAKIPLTESMSFYSLAALARTSFGDYFKSDDNILEYHKLIEFVFQNVDPPPEPGSELAKQIETKCARIHDIVRQTFKERKEYKAAHGEDGKQLFIDVLLGDDFTENERIADSSMFIGAGYSTTAYMMAWALYELAINPDIQEKVYQELVTELGDEPVSLETVPKLRYLRQVIDETLRLYIRYMFSARMADDNTKVGGYAIPKGTALYLAMGIISMDPAIFPDPLKFDPERFTPENSHGRHAYAFKPFGYAGKRICPGQAFANIEMIIFMARFLKSFRFKLVPGQNVRLQKTMMLIPEEEIMIYAELRK